MLQEDVSHLLCMDGVVWKVRVGDTVHVLQWGLFLDILRHLAGGRGRDGGLHDCGMKRGNWRYWVLGEEPQG